MGLVAVLAVALPSQARAASAARASADAAAIRAALQHEVRTHRLPAADAARDRAGLRATLATLRRLARQGEAGRADDLADALDEIADVARRGKLTRLRHLEAFRQLEANRRWFAARSRPGYRERVKLPGDPLVYAYWPGHGLILHPLFNWVEVNRHWFARDIEGMQRQIDALAPLAVRQPGGWLAWEYDFDYGTGRAPWRSAMAQGVALQALARAWKATGDPVDLALARAVLPGLTRSEAGGGLRLDPGAIPARGPIPARGAPSSGAWWPLYAFDPGMRVLNADMQVVISLLSYADITGDQRARSWGVAGAHNAASVLPRYDTGAWSLYEGHAEADLGYHDFMTHQLDQLAHSTGIALFAREHQRFARYRVTPPRVTAPPRPQQVLYPAPRDGFRDGAAASGRLDKRAALTFQVADARGRTVFRQPLGWQGRGMLHVAWDGSAGGRAAAPGRYTLQVVAVDIVGNRSAPQPLARVEVRRDTTPPRLLSVHVGRGARHRIRLRWSVRETESPSVTLWATLGKRTVVLRGRATRGSLLLAMRAPAHPFAVRVRVLDTSGNSAIAVRRSR
jgi:hypothetical protein